MKELGGCKVLEKGSCLNGPNKAQSVPLVTKVCSTYFKGLATNFRRICGYIFVVATLTFTF